MRTFFRAAGLLAVFALYGTGAQARGGHMASDLDVGIVGLVCVVIAICVAESYVRKWLGRRRK
jgi:hypothetical protein